MFGISLFLDHQYLWLFVYIIIGYSIAGWLFNVVTIPFLLIQTYFATKLESFNFIEDIERAEILDENNRVVGVSEGDNTVSTRLAKYFVAFYILNLVCMIIFPEENKLYKWGDYLVTPFLQIIGGTLIIGIPYLIYHKIRYKTFFPFDKRYFYIKVWKTWIVICVIYLVIAILLRLFLY